MFLTFETEQPLTFEQRVKAFDLARECKVRFQTLIPESRLDALTLETLSREHKVSGNPLRVWRFMRGFRRIS